MKLSNLTFHRNGVHGISFYSVIAEKVYPKYPGQFVVTWEENDDTGLIVSSCRAVYIPEPTIRFRGDEIGIDVARELKKLQSKHTATDTYDLTRFI
jgi:hypothetical protein